MLSLSLGIFYVVISYLIGSLCSAVIICKLMQLPDPRTQGSKNPGATNVLRIAGKKSAIMVLVADMLKGLLPVLIVDMLGASLTVQAWVCLAAVMGHIFPAFFSLKGGKGVATTIGALLGLNLILGTVAIAIWLVIATAFKYSSLASMITATLMPIISITIFQSTNAFFPLMLITFMIWFKHSDNLKRLMDGCESKISFSKNKTPIESEIEALEPEDTEIPSNPDENK